MDQFKKVNVELYNHLNGREINSTFEKTASVKHLDNIPVHTVSNQVCK